MLDDAVDVKHVINKTAKSMESLKYPWDAKEVPLTTKIELCQVILMNLVFWSESWSGNKGDLAMMEVFYHK